MPWAAILAIGVFSSFAFLVRRLLTKFDEYESDGKPTLEQLWTRGGGGDPGPGG